MSFPLDEFRFYKLKGLKKSYDEGYEKIYWIFMSSFGATFISFSPKTVYFLKRDLMLYQILISKTQRRTELRNTLWLDSSCQRSWKPFVKPWSNIKFLLLELLHQLSIKSLFKKTELGQVLATVLNDREVDLYIMSF